MASWEDDRMEDHDDHQESHSHSLSRLAACNSSSTLDYENFENYDEDNGLKTMLSRLSIESFDVGVDADEEFSDGNYGAGAGQEENSLRGCLFSDSDDDKAASYSLPSTPLQQQRYQSDTLFGKLIGTETKQYASDNDGQKLRRRRRKRVLRRKKWEERESIKDMNTEEDEDSIEMKMEIGGGERGWSNGYNTTNNSNSFSGESENGGGLRVITRPKGGRRSLCMDMEEVKACRDLGFELEHERLFDLTTMSSGLTLSASTLDTATISSGGSSPIPNWRISSPGWY